jgi:hypothetical protein
VTRTDRYVRVCPHCIETIPSTATTCKFCGVDLTATPVKDAQPQMSLITGAISAVGCVAALAFACFLAIVILFVSLQLGAGR